MQEGLDAVADRIHKHTATMACCGNPSLSGPWPLCVEHGQYAGSCRQQLIERGADLTSACLSVLPLPLLRGWLAPPAYGAGCYASPAARGSSC